MERFRSISRVVLLVAAAVLIPLGVLATWADRTVYDSTTFANRTVSLLDSASVRREMARIITEELARSGNQQAVNFRPAMQLAVEAAVDTDTFRSVFRTAVRRTHQALLTGQGSGAGLDLSDSISIITATLQLNSGGSSSSSGASSGHLDSTLTNVTDALQRYHVFDLENGVATIALVGLFGGLACLGIAIALSRDRRHTTRTVGWILVGDGAFLILLVSIAAWVGSGMVNGSLSSAVSAAVTTALSDLRVTGIGVVAYGLIAIAATSAVRYTPRYVWDHANARVQAWRTSSRGKIGVGVGAILFSLILLDNARWWLDASLVVGAFWIGYLGVWELLDVVRRQAPSGADVDHHRSKRATAGVLGLVVVLVLGLVGVGVFLTAGSAARKASAAGELQCNGAADQCDLRLDEVTFPGAHNAMSSALNPGWLFAEQVSTIKGQLDAGVRALLIDTHYGIASSARMPGSETAVVLTDRAAELSNPADETIDPEVAARAEALAARAPKAAGAKRSIYLCHNYCELGAVSFERTMRDVADFTTSHPDDVLMLVIQDATSPADTAAVIERVGLGTKVATLDPDAPLPTLRELIEKGRTLVVFAERGGSGAPDWYQSAYDHWFQETPYSFRKSTEFSCAPNRGPADAPLFMVNHWLTVDPPNPATADKVNSASVLGERLRQCAKERGLVPNVVAVDFAARGKIAATVAGLGDSLRLAAAAGAKGEVPTPSSSTTTTVSPSTSSTVTEVGVTIPVQTPITQLTGGDAERACAALQSLDGVLAGWASAELSASPDRAGIADLVFAPLLEPRVQEWVDAAPVELASKSQAMLDRAHAANEALDAHGFDAAERAAWATRVDDALTNGDGLDAVSLVDTLSAELDSALGGELVAMAKQFHTEQGDVALVLDLGDVPAQVAADAGLDCLAG
jgi:hypothetical protein